MTREERMMMTGMTLMIAAATLASSGVTGGVRRAAPEPRTAAAVLAADRAWGDAETRGDDAFVEWLLMPAYQSVSPAGRATGKVAIVAGASRSKADPAASAARSAAWKVDHPVRGEVALYGDSAVLTWMSTKPGTEGLVSSCDIFVYRNGHWHPIYSQHSQPA